MSFQAVTFRAADYETPLWAFANTGDGRYNRANRDPPTQYLSLHPMTPWAELLRALDRRTPDRARAVRAPLWTIRIELGDDPEVIDFDSAAAHGLAADDLVYDSLSACQALAAALHDGGTSSLLAPSAALPGTTNLIVLEPAVVIDYHQTSFSPEDWPTALLEQDGRCPEHLWDAVHYRGAGPPHAGLAAWRAGERFEFVQPDVTLAGLRT